MIYRLKVLKSLSHDFFLICNDFMINYRLLATRMSFFICIKNLSEKNATSGKTLWSFGHYFQPVTRFISELHY